MYLHHLGFRNDYASFSFELHLARVNWGKHKEEEEDADEDEDLDLVRGEESLHFAQALHMYS